MQGPKWPFLLRYGSRNTRRIDFPRVDGQSTDPRVLGCYTQCHTHRLHVSRLLGGGHMGGESPPTDQSLL